MGQHGAFPLRRMITFAEQLRLSPYLSLRVILATVSASIMPGGQACSKSVPSGFPERLRMVNMTTFHLPPHLELMCSDGPVLDVFSLGPAEVPDDVLGKVRDRLHALVADPRAAQLTAVKPLAGCAADMPAVVLEAKAAWLFLAGGAGGIRAGTRRNLDADVFASFYTEPAASSNAPDGWTTQAAYYRPPAHWLLQPAVWAAGDAHGEERLARLELAREAVRVFEPLSVLRPRLDALLALYDACLDRGSRLAVLDGTQEEVASEWAGAAGDDVLAALPELAGPVGYLRWAWQGFEAAHGRMAAYVPGTADLAQVACELLIQAKASVVPAELAVAAGPGVYGEVTGRLATEAAGYSAAAYKDRTIAWLSRGLVAGQAEACRIWLDMALRIIAAVRGLPGIATGPVPCALPVSGFLRAARSLSRPRVVPNTLAAWLSQQEGTSGSHVVVEEAGTGGRTVRLTRSPRSWGSRPWRRPCARRSRTARARSGCTWPALPGRTRPRRSPSSSRRSKAEG